MTILNFYLLLPHIFLLNSILALLWVGLYLRNRLLNLSSFSLSSFSIYLLFIAAALFTQIPFELSFMSNTLNYTFKNMVYLFTTIFFSILVLMITSTYENKREILSINVELYFLRLLIIFSLIFLFFINDLLIMFFFLEIYSLSVYILVAYKSKTSIFSSEAGVKYFILSTLFSLVMIYGIALIYGDCGSTCIATLESFFMYGCSLQSKLGIFLILSGLLFKIAAAPFHFWAPDVYEGAPTLTMFFLAVVPKTLFIFLLLKLNTVFILAGLENFIFFSATISILFGSVAGVYQKRLKRLLAYSSINSTGFLILPVLTQSEPVLLLFLIVYLITNVGIFTFILSVRVYCSNGIVKNIHGLSNLFFTNKSKAIILSLLLFSSAGLPLFVGFLSKFFVLFSTNSVAENGFLFITLMAAPFSVFYYIRILKVLSFNKQKYFIYLREIKLFPALVLSLSVVLLIIIFLWSGSILNILNALCC